MSTSLVQLRERGVLDTVEINALTTLGGQDPIRDQI